MKTRDELVFTYDEAKYLYHLGKIEGLYTPYQNSNNKKDVNFDKFIEGKLIDNNVETVETCM